MLLWNDDMQSKQVREMSLTSELDSFMSRFSYLRPPEELARMHSVLGKQLHFLVDGFPRSGNSYFVEVLQFYLKLFNGIQLYDHCIHHIHEPDLLDYCIRAGSHVFLLVRDPVHSVISSATYKYLPCEPAAPMAPDLIRIALIGEFHLWLRIADLIPVHRAKPNLHVCLFEQYRDCPSRLFEYAATKLGLELDVRSHPEEIRQTLNYGASYFLGLVRANSTEESVLNISAPPISAAKVNPWRELMCEIIAELPIALEAGIKYAEITRDFGW